MKSVPVNGVAPSLHAAACPKCVQFGRDDMYASLEMQPQDAEFIAAVRNTIIALLDDRDRLEAQLERIARGNTALAAPEGLPK